MDARSSHKKNISSEKGQFLTVAFIKKNTPWIGILMRKRKF